MSLSTRSGDAASDVDVHRIWVRGVRRTLRDVLPAVVRVPARGPRPRRREPFWTDHDAHPGRRSSPGHAQPADRLRRRRPGAAGRGPAGHPALRPDLVALQEVTRTADLDQAVDLLDPEFTIVDLPGRSPTGSGECLASRWPLGAVNTLDAPVPGNAGMRATAVAVVEDLVAGRNNVPVVLLGDLNAAPRLGQHPVPDRCTVAGRHQRALRRRLGGNASRRTGTHLHTPQPAGPSRPDATRTRSTHRLHPRPQPAPRPTAGCGRLPVGLRRARQRDLGK